MKRGLIVGVTLLGVALAGGVFWLAVHGSTLIRDAVHEYGSPVVGAEIRLAGLEFSPLAGSAAIEGLAIGNPEGFSDADAARIARVAIALDPWSLFSDRVHIRDLTISAPELRVEPGTDGLNLDRLRRNVAAFTGEDTATTGSSETRLRIDRLAIRDARLVVGGGAISFSDQALVLPDLTLEHVGGEEGVRAPDLAAALLDALMPQVKKALASEAGRELLARARDAIGDLEAETRARLEDKAGEIEKKVGDKLGSEAGDKVGKAVKKGLDSLFRKDGKDGQDGGG
ncbi:MAG: hypothetical protein ACE5ED_09355 [Rhodothalassiaceae bacterium]